MSGQRLQGRLLHSPWVAGRSPVGHGCGTVRRCLALGAPGCGGKAPNLISGCKGLPPRGSPLQPYQRPCCYHPGSGSGTVAACATALSTYPRAGAREPCPGTPARAALPRRQRRAAPRGVPGRVLPLRPMPIGAGRDTARGRWAMLRGAVLRKSPRRTTQRIDRAGDFGRKKRPPEGGRCLILIL